MKLELLTIDEYYAIVNDPIRKEINEYFEKYPVQFELPKSLHSQKYGKILELRGVKAETDKDLLCAYCAIWGIENNYAKAIKLCNFIIEQLAILNKEEIVKFEKYKSTAEDIAAGVNKLDKFGVWNILDAISKRQHIQHNDVLELPYIEVITMLEHDLIESEINKKRYENIYSSDTK
jgi:hypothetical protein